MGFMFARKDDRRHKDCQGLTESGPPHCRASCGGGIASEPDTGSLMARSWWPGPGARSWGQVLVPSPGARSRASPPTTAEGCTPLEISQLPRPNFPGLTSPIQPWPNFSGRTFQAKLPPSNPGRTSLSGKMRSSPNHQSDAGARRPMWRQAAGMPRRACRLAGVTAPMGIATVRPRQLNTLFALNQAVSWFQASSAASFR